MRSFAELEDRALLMRLAILGHRHRHPDPLAADVSLVTLAVLFGISLLSAACSALVIAFKLRGIRHNGEPGAAATA